MSANNNTDKIAMQCPCGQRWSVPMYPPEIMNTLRCSVITVAHEHLIRCPNQKCAQRFIFTLTPSPITYAIMPVGDEIVQQMEGSKIIKPALEIVGGIS
jgi:hypothetical protein